MRRSVWLPGLVGLFAMAGAAFGQPASPTAFVLTENGLNTTALAALTIGGDGSVVGTEVVQSGGAAVTYAVQGVMSANDDGTKSLFFNRTSSDAVDADGNPLISSESLKLVLSPAGGYLAF